MTRVLRYPRLSALACISAIACALGRDACVSAALSGWAQVLLIATIALLALCVALLSCRFFVDELGVGVGFLLRVRRTAWEDVASFGLLCCNSRRRYFYGMYHGATDFINLIHRAPQCGSWGFVVPVSRKLTRAVRMHCPFEVDLSPHPKAKRQGRLRAQWHQAAIYSAMMIPAAAVAFITGTLMFIQAARSSRPVLSLPLLAIALYLAGLTLLYRTSSTITTCPGFNEQGVCAGLGVYLPWEEVRFGYVHRLAQMSGLFLLSQPLETMHRRGAPPMFCLSMPDTTTMLLAFLTYCPNAEQGMDA
ncbi:MAG: hypothetical protein IJ313_07150 [Clostridia bacterium]|nr:hypothetical protein [Clostridia bacterium]